MLTLIVCLSLDTNDFGVYEGSRLLHRGTMDSCMKWRKDHV